MAPLRLQRMDRSLETRTLGDYLRVLREHRRFVIGAAVAAAAAAFAFSIVQKPVYEATVSVDFKDPGQQTSEIIGAGSPDFFPQSDAAAGAEIMTRNDVVEAVSAAGEGEFTPDELRSKIEAEVNPQSNLVTLKAEGDDGEEAALIANEFARKAQVITRNDARRFYRERAEALPGNPQTQAVADRLKTLAAVAEPVEIVRPAEAPDSPASPKPLRNTVLAALLGLVVGIGVAFLRHSLDRRVSDGHEIQRTLGIPLVGTVRVEALGMVGMSVNGASEVSEDDLEAFRILRTNVDFLTRDENLGTVAVTSPLPEEGKSTVAAWYAYVNAVAGRRVVLIECDFRRPVLADRFGFEPAPGLGDYIAGDAKPSEVLRSLAVEGPTAVPLPVIPSGFNALQPAEMIASQRFHDFLAQIARAYELVILDSAPLLPVGDTLELIPQVDGLLLCIRLGQTTRDQASSAMEAVGHLPERPMGLVITGLESGSSEDYYGYYSANQGAAQGTGAAN